MKFTIKRVNPLLDMPADKIPQIFTDFVSRRIADPKKELTAPELERIKSQIITYIEAGVVDPELVPIGRGDKRGKEPGITAEDLMRDPDMGNRLYFEILHHSLNVFRGIKGVFFSLKKRLWLAIHLRLNAVFNPLTLSSPGEKQP